MLIDEPEAFLHPPLVRRLGRTLAKLATERNGNVLTSTHSSDFIMGAVQSGVRVNIVRLTYKQSAPTARLLPASDLQSLMRDPLLRSTGVLAALFHEGGAVCEGDQDRAFYQEVNERLVTAQSGGSGSCIFLNAHNKQSIRRVIRPLREMGIAAAAIVDIDILKDDDAKDLWHAAFVPDALCSSWGMLKGNIVKAFKDKNVDMKKGGIKLLDAGDHESAKTFLDGLAAYGVFVVPHGEVQSWFPELGVVGPKKDWLLAIFDKMGTDPTKPGYLQPFGGDVWDFLRSIAAWIADPKRRGMPD